MKYSYLVAVLMVLFVWIVIFVLRKDLRRQMLLMGAQGIPVAFPEKLLIPAYYHPTVLFGLIDKIGFSVETVVFLFSLGGVCSVLYETIQGANEVRGTITIRTILKRYVTLAGIFLATFVSLSLTSFAKHLLSIVIAALVVAIAIWVLRRDLARPILFSSLYGGLLYFMLCAIHNALFPLFVPFFYNTSNLFGVYILRVPIEEAAAGFIGGLMMGGLYEYIFNVKLTRGAGAQACKPAVMPASP